MIITTITLIMVKVALIFELIKYKNDALCFLWKGGCIFTKIVLNNCQYLPFNIAC